MQAVRAAGRERWRIAAVISVVVGPARFNGGLAVHGSKAAVHFEAFDRLLQQVWDRAADGRATFVTGDKHGGRHYYLKPLSRGLPRRLDRSRPEAPGPEPVHDPRPRPPARADPDAASRPVRRPGRAGVDRQQDGSGALDGRLQRILARANPRPAADGGLSRWMPVGSGRRSSTLALAEGHDPAHWWRIK